MYNSSGIVLAEKPSIGVEPTRLYDRSRFKNHGVHTDITMVRTPKGLWVRDFNGSTSKIEVPDSESLKFETGNFSAECWVKPNALDIVHTLVTKAETVEDERWDIRIHSDNRFAGITNNVGNTKIFYSTTLAQIGVWAHLTLVRDGDVPRLYVNGTEEASASGISAFSFSGTLSLYIGTNYSGSSEWANAVIVLSQIYNYALSAGQILKIFNNEKHFFGM